MEREPMLPTTRTSFVGSIPPLPEPIPIPQPIPEPITVPLNPEIVYPPRIIQPWPPFHFRSLRCGCYLIKVTSSFNSLSVADGTLRVECHSNGRTASGDLYSRKIHYFKTKFPWPITIRPFLEPDPDPSQGIPIFPRNRYRYYISVTKILEYFTIGNSFTLEFDMHKFDSSTKTFTKEDTYSAKMFWKTAPAGYPSPGDYLEGDVKNSSGVVVGRMTMGWVSSYLRKATIEIDRVSASESPTDNGAGVDWQTIFDQVGWKINLIESDTNVTEPSDESWSEGECHASMLAWRDSSDLDSEWRYHLLCVRRLDVTSRGIMFDAFGTDSNNVPREGAAISSHWQFTNDPVFPENHPWGLCAALRFGQCTRAYFRTAVHEVGHAMLLYHPGSATGNHILQVTPQIAENAVAPVQFPNNIDYAFSPEDARRLRHFPDVVVRPGTVIKFEDPWPYYTGIPLSPLDLILQPTGIELQVSSLLENVPIGAPVRISFSLINKGKETFPAPEDVSMKSGHVTGKVVDPAGTERTFSTIIRTLDVAELKPLEPEQSIDHSLTLLRGPDGSLFPMPGTHRITINLTWEVSGSLVRVSGETEVMITPPTDDKHAKAALNILSNPDTLLALVVGGDHIKKGIESIHQALENPTLRDHFAYIEAKRVAGRFGKRKADLGKAAKLINATTVMSPSEIKKAAKLVKATDATSVAGKSIAKVLKEKARKIQINDTVKDILKDL